ncbi:MAG TPA: DUF1592 domain-containing protein, partial [Polyangiaceae bacterium]|nr:DUF1592 domain-containing protein [Polyangiaceae bacterium]
MPGLVEPFRLSATRVSALAVTLAMCSVACEGTVVGPSGAAMGSGSETPGAAATSAAAACQSSGPSPGPSPIRRLTKLEYDNTVQDLLGDTSQPAQKFTAEEVGLGFTNNADVQNVSDLLVEQYETAASELAASAVQDLPSLLGCDPAVTGEDDCVRQFLPEFGLRAYRRPLTSPELDRLFGFYQISKQSADFATGVRLTLQAVLQSPYFLYRVESGASASPGVTRVSGYELASRLSYLFWASLPDRALLEAAAAGSLDTADGVRQQAQRLAQDVLHQRSLSSFFDQWLDLDKLSKSEKDPTVFPNFTPGIKAAMRKETELFTSDVAFAGGTLQTLLTADYTFLNQELAAYYGLSGPSGDTFERASLDPARRAGLLSQGGLLAAYANVNQTSPVARGFFVRERLLCAPPAPPPPTVNAIPPTLDPDLTTRERFEQHRTDPSCAGCHALMDPIGFGFE